VRIDEVSLDKLCLDAVVDAAGELRVVLIERMVLVLDAHEHPVDIFPHIFDDRVLIETLRHSHELGAFILH